MEASAELNFMVCVALIIVSTKHIEHMDDDNESLTNRIIFSIEARFCHILLHISLQMEFTDNRIGKKERIRELTL